MQMNRILLICDTENLTLSKQLLNILLVKTRRQEIEDERETFLL